MLGTETATFFRCRAGDTPMLGAAVQKLVVTGFVHRALHRSDSWGRGAEVCALSLDKLLVACCAHTHTRARAHTHANTRAHAHTNARTRTHTHTHTLTNADSHTRTLTHIHAHSHNSKH